MLGAAAWAYVISQNPHAGTARISTESLSSGQQRCHMLISGPWSLSVQSLPVPTLALTLGCLLLLLF